ncbi:hypothetical protein K469DRAFT_744315 [Zopfia rhizophila CBS 207.26]|uniref:DUF6594 domain-containing protein n=1 Tax=Zopfia rhizophila CBS 207.26 TaxID=1314779 RepID=A0A6A6EWF0_9PEZI|nr:hypothetical protein K469DRAFT_744315 [Zopfia rhizophila CBS 207.26]
MQFQRSSVAQRLQSIQGMGLASELVAASAAPGKCSPQEVSPYGGYPEGYSLQVAFQASEQKFTLRGFHSLRTRVLLKLQREIMELDMELEKELDELVKTDKYQEILTLLKEKLAEYDEVLTRWRGAFQNDSMKDWWTGLKKGMFEDHFQRNPYPGGRALRCDKDLREFNSHERPDRYYERDQLDMELIANRAYKDSRWHLKGRHRDRIPTGMAVPLCGIATAAILPCTAALLTNQNWLAGSRAISGVVSTSAGISLIPLQTEPDYDALRWVVRVLWASTYGGFLTCSYMSIARNNHLYLFCSLLLAAHFIAGFAGTAETAETGMEGILMFGPLALTLCAALVYIPFRYRPSSGVLPTRSAGGGDIARRGRSSSAPVVPKDNDGDLGVRAMTGILGVVV